MNAQRPLGRDGAKKTSRGIVSVRTRGRAETYAPGWRAATAK